MLNIKELEKSLDETLEKETFESINKWMDERRAYLFKYPQPIKIEVPYRFILIDHLI